MARNTFTETEMVEALVLKRDHKTWAAASGASGIPRSTLQQRAGAASEAGLSPDTPVLSELDKAKIALRRAQADIRNLQRENDSAERIRTEIYQLAARTPEPPDWIERPVGLSGKRGVPMTIWSDWHYGEIVRPEEVGGLNQFNAEIAAERITLLVNTTIDLCRNHMGRAKTDYPGVIVCLGGDMLSGDIHEELLATNDRTTQQCINDLTDLLISALEKMADEFGKVFVRVWWEITVAHHGNPG